MDKEDALIDGLNEQLFDALILARPLKSSLYASKEYVTEELCVSLPLEHPLAGKSALSFADIDDENFTLYSNNGIWDDVLAEKIPRATLYRYDNLEAVGAIAHSSTFLAFNSNLSRALLPSRKSDRRVNIPLSDDAAKITFYIVTLKRSKLNLEYLLDFSKLKQPI